MIPWPDPLHPAVVHFPLAFLLVGAALACAAVFLRPWTWIAAAALAVGALGALAAVNTGERERSEEIAVPAGEGRRVLDAHEEQGEASRHAGVAAAIVAVAASVLALLAAREVVAAGRPGGELVYHHGVGLRF
ncbi:MAG: hypothetical protein ACOYOL_06830 [Chthoniobacterales bacterium]